jgi:DUF4097 and DUF4098 domain-containing protein YvlB
MKRKRYYQLLAGALLLVSAGLLAMAQEPPAEKATVKFSDPSKPGQLVVENMRGSITVKGYEGKDVIVEARVREKAISEIETQVVKKISEKMGRILPPPVPSYPGWEREKKTSEKAAGMKKIEIENTGLTIEEENNVMNVDVESWKRTTDLIIQVPYSTSLKLNTSMQGNINVEKVNGEIEVENLNGSTTLTNVSGTVVVNTLNGETVVTLDKVEPGKPMSFSSMNGDIDVTLPADVKASFKMKTERGEVYSDFDIALKVAPQKNEEDSRKEGGKYRISFEKAIVGTINGGGPEIQFTTFNGDIYIRKKK